MSETLKSLDCKMVWPWYNVQDDLNKTNLVDVVIDPMSVTTNGNNGVTGNGMKFSITWIHDTLLMVSFPVEDDALIKAFTTVLEYGPTYKYIHTESGLITFEWHGPKIGKDFVEALETDRKNGDITDLKKL